MSKRKLFLKTMVIFIMAFVAFCLIELASYSKEAQLSNKIDSGSVFKSTLLPIKTNFCSFNGEKAKQMLSIRFVNRILPMSQLKIVYFT